MSKAEKTREFIIRKAAPVFNKKGFAGTSMADLTEATGLTKGSIYGNFENKDEVALAVYDYNVGLLNQRLDFIRESKSTAIEKLLAMADFHRSEFRHVLTQGGCPIMNTAIEANDCHPALREKASASIKSWRNSIISVIEEGIVHKEIRPAANAAKFATAYVALIEGGILLAQTTGDLEMLHTCIDRIRQIIDTDLKL